MLSLLTIVFASMIMECVHSDNTTVSDEINFISKSGRSFSDPNFIRNQYFTTKYMPMIRFDLNTASSTFVRIPGLVVVVKHDVPLLFKIYFSAGCYMTHFVHSFIHFMINEKVLINNKLIPNNDSRYAYVPEAGLALDQVDTHGASFMRSSDSSGTYYMCTKYELVYLPPARHVVHGGANAAATATAPLPPQR